MSSVSRQAPVERHYGVVTLLVANVITMVLFLGGGGSVVQALWAYWLQSVIIGVVNVVRMMDLRRRGVGLPPSVGLRTDPVVAFAVPYGFVHLAYAGFLTNFFMSGEPIIIHGAPQTLDFMGNVSAVALEISGTGFAVHHLLAYLSERRSWKVHPGVYPSIGALLLAPYRRIIAMQMVVLAGPAVCLALGSTGVFVVFMGIKTLVDISAYLRGSGR